MTKEDDPSIARYNQRIVKASMKFMKASAALVSNDPNTSVTMPALEEGNVDTGITSEDADMQGMPTQGDSQKEGSGGQRAVEILMGVGMLGKEQSSGKERG